MLIVVLDVLLNLPFTPDDESAILKTGFNVILIHSGQLDRNNEMFLSSERLMLSLGDIAHRAFYANTGSTIAALAADHRR